MAVLDIQVKVTKEAHELSSGLKAFVLHIQKALSDGWQPGADLPVVMQAAIVDLVPAVQGLEGLGAEQKEDVEAFVTGLSLPMKELAFALLKK